MNLQEMDDDRARRVIALVKDAVADELRVAAGISQIELTEDQIGVLAGAVASRLASAFSFDWCPHWVKPGGVHSWLAADGYSARCAVCLADSAPYPVKELAVEWAHRHEASHES